MTHPHPKRNFVPRAVLMKSSLKTLNTARQNSSRAALSVNTARPINTAYPKPTVNCVRPASNVFNRAHSHIRRPFNMFTSNKNNNFNEKVNIVKGNVTTVRPKAVVSDEANAVKASSCWVWRPKLKILDHGDPKKVDHWDRLNHTGRKPALSFMRPFGCSVIILNTIDHIAKFDGKADEGFFLGYSTNSKAFGVFTSRTMIVEENLHIQFRNQSNGSAGTKACDNAGKARVKTDAEDPGNYCEVPSIEELRINQENDDNVNINNNINTVSPTVNAASIEDNVVDENIIYGCVDDPNIPDLEEIGIFSDAENDDSGAEINNLDTYFQVSHILTTRIHKDHPVEQIIRDLNSAPQTRRMTKNLKEHGLFS
ncbi:hypothetical protein Tco_1059868 [Tanacetum coccineum]